MAVDEEEQRLQTMVAQARILEAYLNEITQRENLTGRAILESRASLQAIKALTSSPDEILFPIGAGIFVTASAVRTEKMLADIGAGAVVEKTPEDMVATVERRIKELESALQTLQSQKGELSNQLAATRAAVSDIVDKARKGM